MKMDTLRFIGANAVDFPIVGADPSGPFVLRGADGLGPPEVVIRMARTTLEKATYQGKSVALRQIIAVVGLQPEWDTGQTAEQLRTELYGLLTPYYGQMVRAEIVSDGVVQAYAQGQVSKFETALFTKDPAVQIAIDCDYGYLLSPDSVQVSPAQKNLGGVRAFDLNNPGTAPSAFKMGVTLRSNVGTRLMLQDPDPRGQIFAIDGINWASGDTFVIDTRPGTRGVWRGAAGGVLKSVLNNIDGSVSEWLQLHGGLNTLMLNTTAFDWLPGTEFQYQPAFWGV